MPKGLNQSNMLSLSAGSLIVVYIALSGALETHPTDHILFNCDSQYSKPLNIPVKTPNISIVLPMQ